jgi:hypothetical protein
MHHKTQLFKDSSCVKAMHHKHNTSRQKQHRRTHDMPTVALVKTSERLETDTEGAGAVLPLHAVHDNLAALPQHVSGVLQRRHQEFLLAEPRVDVCPKRRANAFNLACDTMLT